MINNLILIFHITFISYNYDVTPNNVEFGTMASCKAYGDKVTKHIDLAYECNLVGVKKNEKIIPF